MALASISLLALASAAPALAAPAAVDLVWNIPAGPLHDALQIYAAKTRRQLLYPAALVAGRTAAALKGQFGPDEALTRILRGSGIKVEQAGPRVLVLRLAAVDRTVARPQPIAEVAAARPDAGPASADDLEPPASNAEDHGKAKGDPAEIVVTGTHIRGAQEASPIVTITQNDMRRRGDATVADALNRLPQAFNGVASPVTMLADTDRTGTNDTMATGVNLRGLGANATLVLIDGRRMAGTGALGNFTDVSAIPSAAVDHVEVLLDGASAIYGSDAVGGVVNIITKHSYEGADSSIRIGEDQGGGGAYVQASQTLGVPWDGGHLLLTYEYQHNDRLAAADRPYTADSNLTRYGGSNHDQFYSSPGNILGLNAAGTGYVPLYAIPSGDGVGLTPSDFVAGTVNYSAPYKLADIAPEIDRNALYFDVSQALDPKTTIDLEGRYNLRLYRAHETPGETIIQATPANPYYVSPNGAASELIGYSTDQAVGPTMGNGASRSYDLSLGLKRDLGHTWRLDGYVGVAGELGRSYVNHLINSGNFDEALGNTPDNPTTTFSTAIDGFYNPYGDGTSNSRLLRDFIGDGWNKTTDSSTISTASLEADGALFSLPGGPMRAAFGVQFRHERFGTTTYSDTYGTEVDVLGGVVYRRDVSSAFGELNIPLIGAANALPGVERLELSVAGRVEHYDDVGTTANPKIGLIWRPIEDLLVRAAYGTSFRAPALPEIGQPSLIAPTNLSFGSTSTLVLLQYGGNPNLKPETAKTWTAGFDWTPKARSGFRLGLSWFDIQFDNQIDDPGVRNLATVLTNPAFDSLVQFVNGANAADLAKVNALLAKAPPGLATLFPASAYAAIVDARYLNTASTEVSGFDLTLDQTLTLGSNRLGLSASGSYLDTFKQSQVAGAPAESILDTPNNPVNFRGHATADWSQGPYEAAFTLNYVNRYKDPVAHRAVDAWTTCDLSLTWRSPAKSGPASGVAVSLFVQNLLDADPPFYDNPQAIGYDPANADPFGRIVSMQLTKHW